MKQLRESEKRYLQYIESVRAEERAQTVRETHAQWAERARKREEEAEAARLDKRSFAQQVRDAIYVVIYQLDTNKKPSGRGRRYEVVGVLNSQARGREFQLCREGENKVCRVCYGPSTRAKTVITNSERIEYHYYMEEKE